MTIPEDPTDVATFDAAPMTTGYIPGNAAFAIDKMIFPAGADAFTFYNYNQGTFTMAGAGIVNDSATTQSFIIPEAYLDSGDSPRILAFANSASAGDLTAFTIVRATTDKSIDGLLEFNDASTAGTAAIVNDGSDTTYAGGLVFSGTSSAANSTITNQSALGVTGAVCQFYDSSSAGNATITNNGPSTRIKGGGRVLFNDSSSAGASTITCESVAPGQSNYPAAVELNDDSSGGTARIILQGDAELYVGAHNAPGVTLGSLEGNGIVIVTSIPSYPLITLGIGSNNLDTSFSGIIEDTTAQSGGSLAKVGTGVLTLSGANTYAGSTTVNAGELRVDNLIGTGTGTGPVYVNGGILSGIGTIAGTVEVGIGDGTAASLSPAGSSVGTLTVQSEVTFQKGGSYSCDIDTKASQADLLVANGVTVGKGAAFIATSLGRRLLSLGQTFTVINNTSSTPITGRFRTLNDGSIVKVGRNKFQASYGGGDGNDLTLTVVP